MCHSARILWILNLVDASSSSSFQDTDHCIVNSFQTTSPKASHLNTLSWNYLSRPYWPQQKYLIHTGRRNLQSALPKSSLRTSSTQNHHVQFKHPSQLGISISHSAIQQINCAYSLVNALSRFYLMSASIIYFTFHCKAFFLYILTPSRFYAFSVNSST